MSSTPDVIILLLNWLMTCDRNLSVPSYSNKIRPDLLTHSKASNYFEQDLLHLNFAPV